MSVRTMTNYLAPGLLALSAALAIGNWWLKPDRAPAWAAALIVIGCMGLLWFRASRRSAEGAPAAEGKTRSEPPSSLPR